MFRSQEMCLNKLMFVKESMWETMNYLANTEMIMMHLPEEKSRMGSAQSSLAVYGDKTAKNCEETLLKIGQIKTKMEDFHWTLKPVRKSIRTYLKSIDDFCKEQKIHGQKLFEEEDKIMKEKFDLLDEIFGNYERIIKQRVDLLEFKFTLGIMDELIPVQFLNDDSYTSGLNVQIQNPSRENKKFHSILGLVPTKNFLKLQKILFRISRENILLKSKTLPLINDNLLINQKIEDKTLIFILMPSSDKGVMIQQVKTILDNLEFHNLEIFNSRQKNEVQLQNKLDLEENEEILKKTKEEINDIFKKLALESNIPDISYINYYGFLVQREFSFAKNLLYIEEKNQFNELYFWTTKEKRPEIENDLENLNKNDPHFTPPKIEKIQNHNLQQPTFFKTNSFSKAFQEIVDTYGVPRYQECNPGLFTIISFPFLFGIMFGDIGHGLVVLLIGLYLVFFLQDKLSNLNQIKYLILLMGIFSFYCGWIYNEFFSVPLIVQNSCYEKNQEAFVRTPGCTYKFGMDFVWGRAENETGFVNSFKMKFSIIVGVLQMLFGIILKGLNGWHFNKFEDLFFEAIPQFIFLSITFGYMSLLIIVKWFRDFTGISKPVSIIQVFINFFTVDQPLIGTASFQQGLQIFFTILCFICIILMLVPKPLILYQKQKEKEIGHESHIDNTDDISETLILHKETKKKIDEHEDENFSELVVHQMIETIEFVLGSISNTASYLRLWALSLAHGQLAKVFLDLIFGWTIKNSVNPILSFLVIIFGFIFFILITISVILIMDFMECFLHGLRLHWVEFQNKFFKGDGKAFAPFNYQ